MTENCLPNTPNLTPRFLFLPPQVLTNAFTFTAVPSAIEHAGGQAVYVETDKGFRIDIDDLEKKMDSSGAKFLMVRKNK